jgi:hypothetical protein
MAGAEDSVSRAMARIRRANADLRDDVERGFATAPPPIVLPPPDDGPFRNFFRRISSEFEVFNDDMVDIQRRLADFDISAGLDDDGANRFFRGLMNGFDDLGDGLEDAKAIDQPSLGVDPAYTR